MMHRRSVSPALSQARAFARAFARGSLARAFALALPLTALVPGCAGSNASTAATAAPHTPGPISAAERDAVVKDLDASRQAFLASLQGLSEAQYRYKPAPDRWSIAEVAEHIVLADERLFGVITQKVMGAPTDAKLLAQVPHDDARLRTMVTDRSKKVQAPEFLKPTGRFPTMESVQAAFGESRGKILTYAQTTQDDLRGHAAPHPLLKALDGYQWLLLLSAHCERHTAQIAEVKADPNFPRT